MDTKVSIFAGTRPEIIKLAPVRHALIEKGITPVWIATGQHESLAENAYEAFGFRPDVQLRPEWNKQSLTEMSSVLQNACHNVLEQVKPDCVLVQGDTASAYAGAMAGFFTKRPVGHVEAGLRTESLNSPFPEEGFRRLIARIANYHFTPTKLATSNLIKEGVNRRTIFETGNTVVDSIQGALSRARRPAALAALPDKARIVLVTAHRRENWDGQLDGICEALTALRDRFKDIEIVMPVHANPRVREVVQDRLHDQPRIHLIEALPYLEFIWLLDAATLVLSDSGGVQEEGLSVNTPVLVMRESTERTEAIKAGAAKLVGNESKTIIKTATRLLKSQRRLNAMRNRKNPFGDGQAADRIAGIIATQTMQAVSREHEGKHGGVSINPTRRLFERSRIQFGLGANRA